MSDIALEELLRSVDHYYPVGFPLESDTNDHNPQPYQRTAEYERWEASWQAVLETAPRPWTRIIDSLRGELPGHSFGSYTPVCQTACYAVIIYLETPRPDGQKGYRLVRIAGAISLIAPTYLVYGTVEWVSPRPPDYEQRIQEALEEIGKPGPFEQRLEAMRKKLPPRPQVFLHPTVEMEPYAVTMARHIERVLGYRPFPLKWADVPLPNHRIHYLHYTEKPTLLNALFMSQLDNLL